MPKPRRVLCVLCLATLFTFPVAAHAGLGQELPRADFLSALWERLTMTVAGLGGLTGLWAADGTVAQPEPPPPSNGTNRGAWDPNG